MNFEVLSGLVAFAFVSSVTPGPNNLMLMASGANFGFWRTVPHMAGIAIGFTVMVLLVGLGLAQVFDTYPFLHDVLKGVSVLYMVWLAWRIATAAAPGDGAVEGRPFTFLQAAAFQWVNPKAWAMALTAVTAYCFGTDLWAVAAVAGVFGLVNAPAISSWTLLGQQMRHFLTNQARLRCFNWAMAGLLIASLYPVLWPSETGL